MPEGLYANIDYVTTLTSRATVYEKASFSLEGDGRRHLTGYVPHWLPNPITNRLHYEQHVAQAKECLG